MDLQKLATRRKALVERIAQQRADLAMLVNVFERPASYFDKSYAFAQKIKHQPKWVLGTALASAFVFRKCLPPAGLSAAFWKITQWWFAKK